MSGRAYLDDYRRSAERNTVRNWLTTVPEVFKTWLLPFDHQGVRAGKARHARDARIRP